MSNQPLSPLEQHEMLSDITLGILETLPMGWARLIVRGTIVGRYAARETGVKMPDGSVQGLSFPPEAWRKFQDLRHGMYASGLGTWVEFEYVLDPPGRFHIDYNRDRQPRFRKTPTSQDFALENKWFPRSDEHMPDWFRRGLDGASADTTE
ncbi:hypothetical protein [Nocardia concava]|uniref:hypothetical protein n=1 Tax=Nocardia concava TaxID=257281 RepID=UPI0005943B82|nr:hypothetical protein [Nocardia concava]